MLLKFLRRKQCRHKLTVRSHVGFIISEERCLGDEGHKGMHVDRLGRKWMTMDEQQRFLEDHFK